MEVRIVDKKIYIDGMSREDMFKVYLKFRNDLVECVIPHYRPIAFKLASVKSPNNFIETISSINQSYSGISHIINCLVCCGPTNGLPFSGLSKILPANSTLLNNAKFVNLMGKNIGTSYKSSMFYNGLADVNKITDDVIPKFLLLDKDLFLNLPSNLHIYVIMKKGTGILDYSDNANNFIDTSEKGDYMPVRTIYSLSDYLTVCYFDERSRSADNFIEMRYLDRIDESVLNEILYEYFRDIKEEDVNVNAR